MTDTQKEASHNKLIVETIRHRMDTAQLTYSDLNTLVHLTPPTPSTPTRNVVKPHWAVLGTRRSQASP